MTLGGFAPKILSSYPCWTPDLSSPILKRMVAMYTKLFGQEPKQKAIHAGAECGVIGSKHCGMDSVSFGPQVDDVHCPKEHISIKSVEKCWKLLLHTIDTKETV